MVTKRTGANRSAWVFLLLAAVAVAPHGSTPLCAHEGLVCIDLPTGQSPNRPPEAKPDSAVVNQTVAVTISVLANDSDPDDPNAPLTIVNVTQGNKGTVTINGAQTVTYKPNPGASGVDQFTYVVSDGFGGLASTTVTVTINALVLALGFEELDGPAAVDSSPLHYNGTIEEAVRVPGQVRYGNALSFDGVNDRVRVPDAALLRLRTGMTLEAWVNPTASSGWTSVIFKEWGRPGLSYALYARDGAPQPGGTDKPAGYVRINFIDQPVRGLEALPLNTWTHLAVTYDGAVLRFYVNGELKQQRAQTGTIQRWTDPALAALYIGGNPSWGEYFKGLIDDVRIYNIALDTTQIQTDMLTPVAVAAPSLTQ